MSSMRAQVHSRQPRCLKCAPLQTRRQVGLRAVQTEHPQLDQLNDKFAAERLEWLESQACSALLHATQAFKSPVFPCALIAGDVIILHLLHKLKLLDTVKVAFIDTFHLFPETLDFLGEVEARYGFKSHVFHAKDFATKAEYKKVHGSDLPIRDIDEYDRICKVEPFVRALATLNTDVMINGRRRDHGAERAHLQLFGTSKQGLAECQPLAFWEFEDVFAYAARHGVGLHPLHDQGYPSLGDEHSTVPVDRSKWFEYGGERSGRFQGLKNKDGSDKTECGIHTVNESGAFASSIVLPSAKP